MNNFIILIFWMCFNIFLVFYDFLILFFLNLQKFLLTIHFLKKQYFLL